MSKQEFYHSTPKDVRLRIESYNESLMDEARRLSNLAWSVGVYVAHAIGCTFGKGKYPDNPVEKERESLGYIAKQNGKTEEQLSQELMLATLMIDAANFSLESSGNAVGDAD